MGLYSVVAFIMSTFALYPPLNMSHRLLNYYKVRWTWAAPLVAQASTDSSAATRSPPGVWSTAHAARQTGRW